MYYIVDGGRPYGVIPKIYQGEPDEIDYPDWVQCYPTHIKFDTEFEARQFLKKHTSEKIQVVDEE